MEQNKIYEEINDFIFDAKIENRLELESNLSGNNSFMKKVNRIIQDLNLEDDWCVFGKTAVCYKRWKLLKNKIHFFEEQHNYFEILNESDFKELKTYLESIKKLSHESDYMDIKLYSNIDKNDLENFKNIVLKKDHIDLGHFFTEFHEVHKSKMSNLEIFKEFNIKKDKGYRSLKYYKLYLKYNNKKVINSIPANILDIMTKKDISEKLQKKIVKKLEAKRLAVSSIEEYIYLNLKKEIPSDKQKKLEKLSKKILPKLKIKSTSNLDIEDINNIEILLYKIEKILNRRK